MFSLTENYKQLALDAQLSEIGSLPSNHLNNFLNLLREHLVLPAFIPQSFHEKYYSSSTNNKEHSLVSMLAILLLMHFFHFSRCSNFILLLYLSPNMREFCCLSEDKVPDESLISKFKISFDKELLDFLNHISLHVMNSFLFLITNYRDKGFNAYLSAYKNLPKFAATNSDIKLDYSNGHFGYLYKFAMVTNGYGVPLHIHFLDEDFYKE